MNWKKSVGGIAITAYGLVVVMGAHESMPDHFGPSTATVIMPAGSVTLSSNSSFSSSLHYVNTTSDFDYEAAKPSGLLKNDGLTFPR